MRTLAIWASDWTDRATQTGRVALMALGAFWIVAAVWAVLNGPRLDAAGELQTAADTEAESQAVCERLGMPSGTETYAACASELTGVRQSHERRLEGRSLGFL